MPSVLQRLVKDLFISSEKWSQQLSRVVNGVLNFWGMEERISTMLTLDVTGVNVINIHSPVILEAPLMGSWPVKQLMDICGNAAHNWLCILTNSPGVKLISLSALTWECVPYLFVFFKICILLRSVLRWNAPRVLARIPVYTCSLFILWFYSCLWCFCAL